MALSNFDRDEFSAPMAEINTTPLVDVMLVLLVIFLVTAPMLTHSIELQLPGDSAKTITEKKATTLSITSHGNYFIDDKAVTAAELEQNLKTLDKGKMLYIRADKNSNYGKVSYVLALSSKLGLTNIGFLTEPE